MTTISGETDIVDMVIRWPRTADVLHRHGICRINYAAASCPTLALAARGFQIDLPSLLEELNKVITEL